MHSGRYDLVRFDSSRWLPNAQRETRKEEEEEEERLNFKVPPAYSISVFPRSFLFFGCPFFAYLCAFYGK